MTKPKLCFALYIGIAAISFPFCSVLTFGTSDAAEDATGIVANCTGVTLGSDTTFSGASLPVTLVMTENLAEGKPTNQSSTLATPTRDGSSHGAVDGNTGQDFGLHPCSHTASSLYNPGVGLPHWWQVDLEKDAAISTVVIYNRQDNYQGYRLRDFKLNVGAVAENEEVEYQTYYEHSGSAGSIVNITVTPPVCGRYVRIVKQDDDTEVLTLCEVEVFGFVLQSEMPQTSPSAVPAPVNGPTSSATQTAAVSTAERSSTSSSPTSVSSLVATGTDTPSEATPSTAVALPTSVVSPTAATQTNSTPHKAVSSTDDVATSVPMTSPETSTPQKTATSTTVKTPPAKISRCCRCVLQASSNNTKRMESAVEKNMKEVEAYLIVNFTTTSKTIRKKICAEDKRLSSKLGGLTAVVILAIVTAFFVIIDFLSCVRCCRTFLERKKVRAWVSEPKLE